MYFPDVENLGYWHTDFGTGETLWSNELFRIYDLKPGSISPSSELLMKYSHVDDRDMVCDKIHEATKDLKAFYFFHRILTENKATKKLFSCGTFDFKMNGKPIGRYGICLNMTGLDEQEFTIVRPKLEQFTLPGLATITIDPSSINFQIVLEVAKMAKRRGVEDSAGGGK